MPDSPTPSVVTDYLSLNCDVSRVPIEVRCDWVPNTNAGGDVGSCDGGPNGAGHWERKPITEALVFATILVGMNEITEQNVGEFFTRLRIVERVYGPLLLSRASSPSNRYITYKEVRQFVGLHANAAILTLVPTTRFGRKVMQTLREEAEKAKGASL